MSNLGASTLELKVYYVAFCSFTFFHTDLFCNHKAPKFSQGAFVLATVRLVVVDQLSINLPETKSFQYLVEVLQPEAKPISARHLRRVIVTEFKKHRVLLAKELSASLYYLIVIRMLISHLCFIH